MRRKVRKLDSPRRSVDELHWPVDVALVILGGFLIGSALSFQRFQDPVWFRNAWTTLLGVPLFISVGMVATRAVSRTWLRRSLQFGMLVSLLVHLILLLAAVEIVMPNKPWDPTPRPRDIVRERQQRTVPDHTSFQLTHRSDEPSELERPVETEPPRPTEPDPPEEREVPQSPVDPQPQPVREPEETARPDIVKRATEAESIPRLSEQASRHSRSREQRQPSTQQAASSPAQPSENPAVTPAARMAPADVAVTQPAPAPSAARPSAEPAAEATAQTVTPRESSDQPSASRETPQSPTTLRRDATTANFEPSIAAANEPRPAAQSFEPPVLAARDTEVPRQQSAPASQGRRDSDTQPAAQRAVDPELRRNNINEDPLVAQTPQPTAERQPRLTERAASDAVAAPTTSTNQTAATAQPALQPSPSSLVRQPTSTPVERPDAQPQAESPPQVTVAQTAPADRSAVPSTTVAAAAPQREATASRASPVVNETAVPRETVAATIPALNATATGVERQATPGSAERAAVTAPESLSNPTATAAAMTPATSVSSAQQPTSALATSALGRSATSTPAATPAAAEAESIQPSAALVANAPGVRPTDASVSRQAVADAASVTASRQPLETPQASSEQQLANAVSRRAITSDEPTMLPLQRPTNQPARATSNATPRTTIAMDSPASRVTSEPAPSTAQPAPIALARGEAGTAGSGYSPNLDRAAPAGESPSQVASGSSQPRATQVAEEGPALSPAAAAAVPRARSDRDVARSAETIAANFPGPGAPSDSAGAAQTASAATTELQARADAGRVTADRGEVQVDLGPQRIVAQFQTGRASGGGQPELSFSDTSRAAPPTRGGATQAALAVDTTAQQVAAPTGDGGSRPQAIDAQPAAVTAQRTDAGGNSAASGAPTTAQLEGPAAEMNAADARGALALRRAPAEEQPGATQGISLANAADGGQVESPLSRRASSAAPTTAARPAADLAANANPGGSPAANTDSSSAMAAAGPAPVAPESLRGAPPVGSAANSALRPDAAGSPSASPAVSAALPPERRSESADAPEGAPVIGGGNSGPQRLARSSRTGDDAFGNPSLDTLVLNATRSDGAAPPAVESGVEVRRREGGISASYDPSAAAVADQAGLVATPAAVSLRPGGAGDGAQPAAVSLAAAVPRSSTTSAPVALTGSLDLSGGPSALPPASPSPGGGSTSSVAETPVAIGPQGRTNLSALRPVEIDAQPGEGGLAVIPTPDAGIDDRRARLDVDNVQSRIARIPRRDLGGRPNVNSAPVIATEAFRRRAERTSEAPGGDRLGPETERAIELGLVFLARYQQEDGRWSLDGFDRERPGMQSDAAATALALLAFQGAGYTHQEHRYANVVRAALEFLIANQNGDGAIYVDADEESNRFSRLYTQGIATLALCEAYGMTQDEALKEPAQRAIEYIVATQNDELGGWRYAPNFSSDTSVSGWMMMAMKSGELAGLQVPAEAYQGVVNWLDRAQASASEPHLYRYNPDAPDTPEQGHGRTHSPTMTAVGLLMRLYTGWNRDHAAMKRGADYFRANLPAQGEPTDPILSRRRDTYYWYYATQVMFHVGGDHWREWNARLHPMLERTQVTDGPLAGSWDPFLPVADRWAGQAGRLYVTTLNLLSLEVQYRHLPLYESEQR